MKKPKIIYKTMRRVVAIVLIGTFFLSDIVFAIPEHEIISNLAPSLSLQTKDFGSSYVLAALCRAIEQNVSLEDEKAISNICDWAIRTPNPDMQITPGVNEIIIDVPREKLAIRYFDPTKANVVTPYSDVSKLETRVIGPKLNRQMIHRLKELPVIEAILENDRTVKLTDIPLDEIRGKYFLIRTNLDDTHFDLSESHIDDIRINRTAATVDHITRNGGIAILFNHIGRPNGEYVGSLRTNEIAEALGRVLNKPIKKMDGEFLSDGSYKLIGETERRAVLEMRPGDAMMLENTRMDPREQSKDPSQRNQLAKDIVELVPEGRGVFVMDGFPITHRFGTASVTDIARLLPGVKGLWELEEEALHEDFLSWLSAPQKRGRLTAIFGGKKEDKKEEIARFSETHLKGGDTLILGGKFGERLIDKDTVENLTRKGVRVLFPLDSNEGKDIGPKTIGQIQDVLRDHTDTLFWEGPLGKFEEEPFSQGTFQIARLVAALTQGKKIKRTLISGGELGFATKQALGWNEFTRNGIEGLAISTGGGTSIAYLADHGNLPGTRDLRGWLPDKRKVFETSESSAKRYADLSALGEDRKRAEVFRRAYEKAFGKDVLMVMFDTSSWVNKKNEIEMPEEVILYLQEIKDRTSGSGVEPMLVLTGNVAICKKARDILELRGLFDREDILIYPYLILWIDEHNTLDRNKDEALEIEFRTSDDQNYPGDPGYHACYTSIVVSDTGKLVRGYTGSSDVFEDTDEFLRIGKKDIKMKRYEGANEDFNARNYELLYVEYIRRFWGEMSPELNEYLDEFEEEAIKEYLLNKENKADYRYISSHFIKEKWGIKKRSGNEGLYATVKFYYLGKKIGEMSVDISEKALTIHTCQMHPYVSGQKIGQEMAARALVKAAKIARMAGLDPKYAVKYYTLTSSENFSMENEDANGPMTTAIARINDMFGKLGFYHTTVDAMKSAGVDIFSLQEKQNVYIDGLMAVPVGELEESVADNAKTWFYKERITRVLGEDAWEEINSKMDWDEVKRVRKAHESSEMAQILTQMRRLNTAAEGINRPGGHDKGLFRFPGEGHTGNDPDIEKRSEESPVLGLEELLDRLGKIEFPARAISLRHAITKDKPNEQYFKMQLSRKRYSKDVEKMHSDVKNYKWRDSNVMLEDSLSVDMLLKLFSQEAQKDPTFLDGEDLQKYFEENGENRAKERIKQLGLMEKYFGKYGPKTAKLNILYLIWERNDVARLIPMSLLRHANDEWEIINKLIKGDRSLSEGVVGIPSLDIDEVFRLYEIYFGNEFGSLRGNSTALNFMAHLLLLHDLGKYVYGEKGHEARSEKILEEVFKDDYFGFNEHEKDLLKKLAGFHSKFEHVASDEKTFAELAAYIDEVAEAGFFEEGTLLDIFKVLTVFRMAECIQAADFGFVGPAEFQNWGKIYAKVRGKVKDAYSSKATKLRMSTPEKYAQYMDRNAPLLQGLLGENRPDVLLRVSLETVEQFGKSDVAAFVNAFQKAPNAYVEFYYMSGACEKVTVNVYETYGISKKELPQSFRMTRENTVTLLPVLKGEEITDVTIKSRLGDLDIKPTDTILSPIGLQNDPVGLVRGTVLGLKIMSLARVIAAGKGKDLTQDSQFKDTIQCEVMEIYKQICDPEHQKDLAGLTPEDILTLAAGKSINDILAALKKVIKLLPITPIDPEELRHIYEHARQVLLAA